MLIYTLTEYGWWLWSSNLINRSLLHPRLTALISWLQINLMWLYVDSQEKQYWRLWLMANNVNEIHRITVTEFAFKANGDPLLLRQKRKAKLFWRERTIVVDFWQNNMPLNSWMTVDGSQKTTHMNLLRFECQRMYVMIHFRPQNRSIL